MDKEYAAAIGGRVTDLLTENSEAIQGAFKAHGDTLKVSIGVILSANGAAVILSFDPRPTDKLMEVTNGK